MSNNKPFNDSFTLAVMADSLKNLLEQAKTYKSKGKIDIELDIEIRECFVWLLNIFVEFLIHSTDRDIQMNPDLKKIENQVFICFILFLKIEPL